MTMLHAADARRDDAQVRSLYAAINAPRFEGSFAQLGELLATLSETRWPEVERALLIACGFAE